MEIDPLDIAEQKDVRADDAASKRHQRLNNLVALTIALLATFMGICKVKDDNIVQAMQQAQVDRNDHWAWYQARNIRTEVLDVAAQQMHAINAATPTAAIESLATKFEGQSDAQTKKMAEVKAQAEGDEKTYNALNYHDDQFDLMEAGLSIAIAMLAMASLTESFWLFYIALLPTAFGVVMGAAGLFAWNLHPDRLAQWLGT